MAELDRIGCREIHSATEVPAPLPKRQFMLWVGPVMTTVALGLGTSEVILYPNLTARFGVGWLGLMVAALFLQTVWGQELARWTVVSGEHALQGNARVLKMAGAAVSIGLFMFLAFAIPAWATAAASALRELLGWPIDVKLGTVFWAFATFLLALLLALGAKVARKYIEHVATWTTVLAWLILILAACLAITSDTVMRMAHHLVYWSIPPEMDWWVLGSTLAWVGAGPTLIWYTYWMRDAGWGMAKHIAPIPGWRGTAANPTTIGFLPQSTPTNQGRLTVWIRRSHFVLWIGYFLGSLLTIFIFVGLSDSILRPQGLTPSGFDVVKHQAQFFAVPLGPLGYSLFLVVAWLLFFNTQLTVAEALVRQNADFTWSLSARVRAFFHNDIRKAYFLWWGLYLLISFALIIVQYFVPGATPFDYATKAAMLSFVSLVFSMAATLVGALTFYRHPAIRAHKPHAIWILLLAIGLVTHVYLILRATGYQFGFWK